MTRSSQKHPGHDRTIVAHDDWFRRQVADAVREADNPATEWIPHAVVKQDMARQRAELLARVEDKAS